MAESKYICTQDEFNKKQNYSSAFAVQFLATGQEIPINHRRTTLDNFLCVPDFKKKIENVRTTKNITPLIGGIFYDANEVYEKFMTYYTDENVSLVVSDLVNKCLASVGFVNFAEEVEKMRNLLKNRLPGSHGGRKTIKKRNLTKRRKSKNKTMVKSNRRKLR